jgi:nucleoside-diphosphate-sugar epimerase
VICLVTGAAGFIGSHLSRRLLQDKHVVIGVDAFTDDYPRWIKERNVAPLLRDKNFEFVSEDMDDLDLPDLLGRVEAVFHLAAKAGVRASWGRSFDLYIKNNVMNTQRLLEAARTSRLEKIVFASSSSVYGATRDLPMLETSPVSPLSPYGVTKLAAEKLCDLYFRNYGVPAVSLRFFTVYGPGQRPDMAFHIFLKAILLGQEITVFGDGRQTRDFTFVSDIVEACASALRTGRPGEAYNVGGGHRETLDDLFPLLEEISGKKALVRRVDRQKGDVPDTWAGIEKARRDLAFVPRTDLALGLRQEWDWIRSLYKESPSST